MNNSANSDVSGAKDTGIWGRRVGPEDNLSGPSDQPLLLLGQIGRRDGYQPGPFAALVGDREESTLARQALHVVLGRDLSKGYLPLQALPRLLAETLQRALQCTLASRPTSR
jgi:hypothetical protein